MMCFTGLFQKKINIIVKLHFNLTFDFVITEAVKLTITFTLRLQSLLTTTILSYSFYKFCYNCNCSAVHVMVCLSVYYVQSVKLGGVKCTLQ